MQAHPDIIIRLTSGAEPIDLTRTRELDRVISYGAVRERTGIVSIPLGIERIAPMCSPTLLNPALPTQYLLSRLTLIDSQLSPVTWADWFSSNALARLAQCHNAGVRCPIAFAPSAATCGFCQGDTLALSLAAIGVIVVGHL